MGSVSQAIVGISNSNCGIRVVPGVPGLSLLAHSLVVVLGHFDS